MQFPEGEAFSPSRLTCLPACPYITPMPAISCAVTVSYTHLDVYKRQDLYLEKGRKGYRVEKEDRQRLLDLFDRGGQTEGYYRQHNGRDMVVMKEKPSFRQENRELYQYLDETYVEAELKEPVSGTVAVKEGEPLSLTLRFERNMRDGQMPETVEVTVAGEEAQQAKNQPVTEEKIAKQIGKTGNTPFYFRELNVCLLYTSRCV